MTIISQLIERSRKEWPPEFKKALRMRVSADITAAEFFEAFKVFSIFSL